MAAQDAEQQAAMLRSPLLMNGGNNGTNILNGVNNNMNNNNDFIVGGSGRPSISDGSAPGMMPSSTMSSEGRDIMIDYRDLEYQKVLGKGGFSTVYSGKAWGRLPVAIKVMHVPEISREVVNDFLNEAKFIMSFKHTNLVRFVGACISPPDFAIAMELCSKRSLADLLKLKVNISQYRAIQIAMAVANALKYMHSKGVIHRDLKAGNILFGKHGEAKVRPRQSYIHHICWSVF
jgi:serine/threonine protein kinase